MASVVGKAVPGRARAWQGAVLAWAAGVLQRRAAGRAVYLGHKARRDRMLRAAAVRGVPPRVLAVRVGLAPATVKQILRGERTEE